MQKHQDIHMCYLPEGDSVLCANLVSEYSMQGLHRITNRLFKGDFKHDWTTVDIKGRIYTAFRAFRRATDKFDLNIKLCPFKRKKAF